MQRPRREKRAAERDRHRDEDRPPVGLGGEDAERVRRALLTQMGAHVLSELGAEALGPFDGMIHRWTRSVDTPHEVGW